MELKNLNVKSLFFLIIFIGLGYLLLRVLAPFFNVIVISIILAQLFNPLYKKILKYTKQPVISSILTTLATVSLVIIPIVLIVILATAEIVNITRELNLGGENLDVVVERLVGIEDFANTQLSPFYERFSFGLDSIADSSSKLTISLADTFGSAFNVLSNNVIVPTATTILEGGINFVFYGILLIVTLIYLFMEYDNIPELINRISPLDDEVDRTLYRKFTDTSKAVIVGNFVVALVQATVIIPILLLLGIGAPALLWIIMFLFSLIPVGSGIVWLPVGAFLILSGNPLAGILLIFYGVVALNIVEATVRPYLLKDSVQLHPLLIIFTALGGVAAFGALGLLYGPLLAVFFNALMEIYAERYSGTKNYHAEVHHE